MKIIIKEKNTKLKKNFNETFDKGVDMFGKLGAILGFLYMFVDFCEDVYSEFDVVPVGLITLALTLIVYMLPVVLSIVLGGGIGWIVGTAIGVTVFSAISSIVTFFHNRIETAQKRKEMRIAERKIRKTRQGLQKNIVAS